jgi:flagellar assembly protein FliH
MEMINMSSNAEMNIFFPVVPVMALQYREIGVPELPIRASDVAEAMRETGEDGKHPNNTVSKDQESAEKIRKETAEAVRLAEERLRRETELKLNEAQARVSKVVAAFEAEKDAYFSKVEAEVVQLSLAIASKILHREAQIDPTLLAALVRMTLERIREGSNVILKVSPGQEKRFSELFAKRESSVNLDIQPDSSLSDSDCILETELGKADLGLSAQLKEVEQGFFDLLALRPGTR